MRNNISRLVMTAERLTYTISVVLLMLWLSACGGGGGGGGSTSLLPSGSSVFYKFNETVGASTVSDSANAPASNFADNGLVYNSTSTLTPVQGWWNPLAIAPMLDPNTPNGGVHFNNFNYIEVPHSPDLDFGAGDFTIATWVNPVAGTTHHALLDKTNAGGTSPGWALYLDSTTAPPGTTKVVFWMNGIPYSSNGVISTSYAPPGPGGVFTSIVVVVSHSTNTASIYINGALDTTILIPPGTVSNTSSLLIAKSRGVIPSANWAYTMSGLVLYKRALTPNEVSVIYTAGVGAL